MGTNRVAFARVYKNVECLGYFVCNTKSFKRTCLVREFDVNVVYVVTHVNCGSGSVVELPKAACLKIDHLNNALL